MISNKIILFALFTKLLAAQKIGQANLLPRSVITEKITTLSAVSPAFKPNAFSNQVSLAEYQQCKNLADAIQMAVLAKLRRNSLKKPVFRHVAGPLINDIQSALCSCSKCNSLSIPNSIPRVINIDAANAQANLASRILGNGNSLANAYKMAALSKSSTGFGAQRFNELMAITNSVARKNGYGSNKNAF